MLSLHSTRWPWPARSPVLASSSTSTVLQVLGVGVFVDHRVVVRVRVRMRMRITQRDPQPSHCRPGLDSISACRPQEDPGTRRSSARIISYSSKTTTSSATRQAIATENPAPTVWPALRYDDTPAAIRFLVEVLGFTETLVVAGPNDSIAHADLRWPEGGAVMLGSTRHPADGVHDAMTPAAGAIYVESDHVDAIHDRVVAAGVPITAELHDTDFGSHTFRRPGPGAQSGRDARGCAADRMPCPRVRMSASTAAAGNRCPA